jgi:HSP20 family protein
VLTTQVSCIYSKYQSVPTSVPTEKEVTMLLRFDPFREADRLFDETFARPQPLMPMDAVRRDDHVEVALDLPGVDPDSIDLTVERNVLTVRASRTPDRRDDDEVIAGERRHGTFSRQLFLGDTLDTGALEASYDHGVLRITVPVAAAAKPRKVEVSSGGGSEQTSITEVSESSEGQADERKAS